MGRGDRGEGEGEKTFELSGYSGAEEERDLLLARQVLHRLCRLGATDERGVMASGGRALAGKAATRRHIVEPSSARHDSDFSYTSIHFRAIRGSQKVSVTEIVAKKQPVFLKTSLG